MMHSSADKPVRIAFGSIPKDGGTFTFYRNLRPILARYGYDLRCVVVGRSQCALIDERFWDDGCVRLAQEEQNLKRQAQAFASWCQHAKIDIAIGVNSHPILAALLHLPSRVRTVSRCANGFEEGYRLSLVGHERLRSVVALVPRLRDDLVAHYGVDPERIELIPNGIDPAPFQAAAKAVRGTGNRLELGFVGRLEHRQKGVFHLQGIVEELLISGVPFRLRIAGKGKHERLLRSRLARHVSSGHVEFIGSLGPRDVPDFLGSVDAYLFTSHFEGCPNALLEAMMAGAVPVSWNLAGITDYLVEHDKTGFLAPIGSAAGMARAIKALHEDRDRLQRMSQAVSAGARQRFSNELCAVRYCAVFEKLLSENSPAWQPEPWSVFDPDPIIAPRMRSRIASAVRHRTRYALDLFSAQPHLPNSVPWHDVSR